ncbi:hypothetical protein, partial [Streptococcus salivarius]|uniref:hypothetical protein n=1 Tax=Streptococcus salivarius TaxID=1304 RepID=UPI00321BFC6B
YYWIIGELGKNIKKTNIKNDVCLHSGTSTIIGTCFFIYLKNVAIKFKIKTIIVKPIILPNTRL